MNDGLQGVLVQIGNLINLATPIVVALALLYFFWGLATYILNAGGEGDGKKKGRDIMIWGILALFVMVSVWGIINIVRDTFNLDQNNTINVPCITGTNSEPCAGQTNN